MDKRMFARLVIWTPYWFIFGIRTPNVFKVAILHTPNYLSDALRKSNMIRFAIQLHRKSKTIPRTLSKTNYVNCTEEDKSALNSGLQSDVQHACLMSV